jgi:hypothetical protein
LNDESLLNDFYTILDEQKAFATNCFIFSTLNAKKAPLANSMRFGNCLTSFARLPKIKTLVYKLPQRKLLPLECTYYPLNDKFMPQCTAKSKRTKIRCKRFTAPDRTVCKFHGGKSPQGFEHYKFRDGKTSKFISHLPESLKADFHKNLGEDKDPQSLREQIAVSLIRTQQLLALLSDGDLANLWSRMKEHLFAIKNNLALGLDTSADLNALDNLATIGEQNFLTWQQINNQNEQTRKLAESQIKVELGNLDRQIKENNYIPKEFVRAFVLELADVVMRLSPESVRHEQLKQIQKRFMSLPPVIRDDDAPNRLDKGK